MILSSSVERCSSSTIHNSHQSHKQFLDQHRNCFLQLYSPSFTTGNVIDLQRLYFQEGLKFPRGHKHSIFPSSQALVWDTVSLTQQEPGQISGESWSAFYYPVTNKTSDILVVKLRRLWSPNHLVLLIINTEFCSGFIMFFLYKPNSRESQWHLK